MSVLQLIDVVKEYPVGDRLVRALDHVNFELGEREVVGLLGPSGSGKTTLLTIGGALQRPTSGKVILSGREIQELSERELARVRREKIGFIFQSYNLLAALTAAENVQYMLELKGFRGRHARERARNILEMLGMGHRADELPKRLSGGEQQRVAVARAFASGGDLILADEPTANLDNERATELAGMLRALSRDLAIPVLMVTHDYRASQAADRLFWLEGGHMRPFSHDAAAALAPHDPPAPPGEAEAEPPA
jgi:putative ABC transport system ATP-binding protein